MYTATRIQYEPVNITFHDDHADTVNAFWKKYYEYTIADGVSMNSDLQINETKDDYYRTAYVKNSTNKYGLDTPKQRGKPYIKGIEIFVLHKQRFTSMTLVNPVIGSFAHDSLDQADGAGVMQNTMQIFYETVLYKSGIINVNTVPGFATINYDKFDIWTRRRSRRYWVGYKKCTIRKHFRCYFISVKYLQQRQKN
jgi:hypothetical protein